MPPKVIIFSLEVKTRRRDLFDHEKELNSLTCLTKYGIVNMNTKNDTYNILDPIIVEYAKNL
jgi:hypothetical protein